MDIFLSYNSADHHLVENIARKLRDETLEPFLDRWHLSPGMRWRVKLEETLISCKAVAVFVGPGEMGSWQQREVDVALDLQRRNPKLPVIPVLLPGCEPPLGFLRQLTWVDLRTQTLDRGIAILAKAARGELPGPEIQKDSHSVRASICPYRGLLHFREEDAPFFFGREAAIDKLMDVVPRQPFVAVVGASGSGKSSVVRAGLVPKLRRDRRTAWETLILVPADRPLKSLAMALVPLLEPTLGEVDRLAEAAKLAEHLRSGAITLYDIVERVLDKHSGTDRVLIVVDQFEELYTLSSDEDAGRRFLDELLAASSRTGSRLNVALTLRGDFVGRAFAYRQLSDRLQDAQINLGPMTREELECAIRKPAEKIQLEFEPRLVRRILNDVGDEPGNLPLLEFVLKELWDKRHGRVLLSEAYDAIGGLHGAVATKADELLQGLSSAEQIVLQRVFLRIVRPSESGLDTRRRAAFAELPPEGAELVLKLVNERLLVTNQSGSEQERTVEVAHEALISNWSTLRAWVNEDREFLLWRDRLGTLLTEWERAQESEEALLRGPLLIEAQKWFDQRTQDFSDQERKFISASRELRERLAREEIERQERELEAIQKLARTESERADDQTRAAARLRWLATIMVAIFCVAVIAAIFGFYSAMESHRSAQQALSRQLGAESLADVDALPQRSLLLAAESVRLARGSGIFHPEDAAKLLHTLLGETGGVPLAGHAGAVTAVAFSDGHTVATGSADGTTRLWDAEHPLAAPIVLSGHKGPVTSLAFSGDGRWLATASADGTARLWDAKQPLAPSVVLAGHQGAINAVAISADSHWLATASDDHTARLWDLKTANPSVNPVVLAGHTQRASYVTFSPTGRWLATASNGENTVWLWDMKDPAHAGRRMTHKVPINEDAINAIAFSPDERRLAVTFGYIFQLWDLTAAEPSAEPFLEGRHKQWILALGFSPDGHWLATAAIDALVKLWDLTAADPAARPLVLYGHRAAINALTFSSTGRWLATAGQDATARLWDLADPTMPSVVLRGHESAINALTFSPDGLRLATASNDAQARLWDIPDPSLDRAVMRGHSGIVHTVAFSPDGKRLVTGSDDGNARVWDVANPHSDPLVLPGGAPVTNATFSADRHWLATGSTHALSPRLWNLATADRGVIPVILRQNGNVRNWAFTPDGRWLATIGLDGNLRLWKMDTGAPSPDFSLFCEEQKPLQRLVFSGDGSEMATLSFDNTARLWRLADKKPPSAPFLILGDSVVSDLAVSSDGGWLATASWEPDFKAKLWQVTDAMAPHLLTFLQFKDRVSSVAFSPDAHWLAAAAHDQTIQLLDITDPTKAPTLLLGHQGRMFVVSFSPDGQSLASLSEDHTIRLWDPARPTAEPAILHDDSGFSTMSFSPDGRWLATGSDDGTVRLWWLQVEELTRLARLTAGRDLTKDERKTFLGSAQDSQLPK
jgi:WD40 repeat protein/type II secretory pathway predicted ATPase ExeA